MDAAPNPRLPRCVISLQHPINQPNLPKRNSRDSQPREPLTDTQAGLAGARQPKLEFHCSYFNRISITQNRALNLVPIDGGERARWNTRHEPFIRVQIDLQMLVPHSLFFKLQIRTRHTPDPYRKTAGGPGTARHFSRQKLKLDHYKSRRGT